jgi:hypothetical protein
MAINQASYFEILLSQLFLLIILLSFSIFSEASEKQDAESWWVAGNFEKPTTIAVLPMDNFSLEPTLETSLFEAVYKSLTAKGYVRIKADRVKAVMQDLGVQTPGQLAGFSPSRLQQSLSCDATLGGRIDQSAAIHAGVYDAVVVSITLFLTELPSGKIIWQAEQWRTAHRQWQLDPLNMLLNFTSHENGSREDRIKYLVHEMLKTLPKGPVRMDTDNLLDQAIEIKAQVD